MDYYNKKIAEIKQKLQTKTKVPVFNPDNWVINSSPLYTNCYAYCLDLDVEDPETTIFIPGSISNKNASKNILTISTLIKNLKNDLEFLGISYRDNKGLLNSGEYRIGIFTGYIYPDHPISFHFVRQDSDGKWSEKFGWNGPVFREVDISTPEPQTSGLTGCEIPWASYIIKLPAFNG